MDHGAAPTGAAPNMADDQCNCTTAHIDPNCYCPPDSPKGRASSGGAAAPHALTHSHESLGSFTRNLSAMSLDDARDGEKPPGRVSPDIRGSALTEAARTLSNISADAGVAPAAGPAPYAPLAPPPGAGRRREAGGRRGATVGAGAGLGAGALAAGDVAALPRDRRGAAPRARFDFRRVRRPRYESGRLRRLSLLPRHVRRPGLPALRGLAPAASQNV